MKKIKLNNYIAYIMLFVVFSLLAGCNNKGESKDNNQEKENEVAQTVMDVTVAALKGPTAIGMVKLMEDASNKLTTNNYVFMVEGTVDKISVGLMENTIMVAAIPCNLASVLYNKTNGNIQVAAINTVSALYIVEKGNSIQSIQDLKGKTIYTTGKGTTPEYILNYVLKVAGLDPEKDVKIEYKSEAAEAGAVFLETEGAVAMLPQPYVTTVMMQDETVRIALDIAKEWEAYSDDESSVVTGVVVVNVAMASDNKEVVEALLSEYEASTEYVTKNVKEAAELVEKYNIVKASVAEQAIPHCGIAFIKEQEMKEKVNGYLSVLYEQNPQSVGGALPSDDFYYNINH